MTKAFVLQQLRQHAQNQLQLGGVDKKSEKIYAALMTASENDIVFGDCPSCFCAYAECNSTGVGTSSYEGTTTQRTVALDYTTDPIIVVDGHEGAAVKGLELFYLRPGETCTYYRKDRIEDYVNLYGNQLHLQQFRDLNFLLKSHRVNRYTVKITAGPETFPIRPVFLAMEGSKEPVQVGYAYVRDEREYVLLDIKKVDSSKGNKGCFSPWMLVGLIFPPILIVALCVGIYRIVNSD